MQRQYQVYEIDTYLNRSLRIGLQVRILDQQGGSAGELCMRCNQDYLTKAYNRRYQIQPVYNFELDLWIPAEVRMVVSQAGTKAAWAGVDDRHDQAADSGFGNEFLNDWQFQLSAGIARTARLASIMSCQGLD